MAVTELTDAELLDRARGGDEAAFTSLYVRHHAAIRRLAVSYRCHEPDDLVDATFAQVVAELRRRTGPNEAFRGYLFAVMHLQVAERPDLARRPQVAVPPSVVAVASSPALGGSDRVMTTRAFESLPPHWQVALWHTTVLGCGPDELADALDLPAQAAPALARYAGRKLRQAYLQTHLDASPRPGCEPHRQRLTAHLRGSLDPTGDEAAREHLDRCASCRDLVAALDGLDELLTRSVAPLFPAGQVWPGGLMPLAQVDATGQPAVVEVAPAGADTGRNRRVRASGQFPLVGGAAAADPAAGGADEPTTGSNGRVRWWPFGDRAPDGAGVAPDAPGAFAPAPDTGPGPAFGADGARRRTTGPYSAVSVFPTAADAWAARARATTAGAGGPDGPGGPGGDEPPVAGDPDAARWTRAREVVPTIGGVAAATVLIAGLAVLGTAAAGDGEDTGPEPAVIDDVDPPDRDRDVDGERRRPPGVPVPGSTSTTAADTTTTTTGDDEAGDGGTGDDELAATGDRAVASGAPSTGGGTRTERPGPGSTSPPPTRPRPTTTVPEPPPLASWQASWSGGTGEGTLGVTVASPAGARQTAPVHITVSVTSGVTVTGAADGCSAGGSSVSCTVPAPAPGDSVSLAIGLAVEGDGQSATVSARQDGAGLGSSTVTLTGTAPAPTSSSTSSAPASSTTSTGAT